MLSLESFICSGLQLHSICLVPARLSRTIATPIAVHMILYQKGSTVIVAVVIASIILPTYQLQFFSTYLVVTGPPNSL